MTPTLILCLVLLATLGLVSLLVSGLLAIAWRTGLKRMNANSADLLTLRLLPAVSGLLIAVTVVLPAFRNYEPSQEREAVGPLLALLAAFSLVSIILGVWRGWHACALTRALLRDCEPSSRRIMENGQDVLLVEVGEPLAAVVKAWRPQIVTAESLRSLCERDEYRQVIAHEKAHIQAWDNLKLLLLLATPDALAWTSLGPELTNHWRAAAEREADQRSTGDDRQKRLALASALVKMARLLNRSHRARGTLGMSSAMDDVPGRVRRLLQSPARPVPSRIVYSLALGALLIPVAALPLHALVHELCELLVRFGL